MSTLRISNIEAKSVPASATIDEKVKITNSSGDPLVFIDGKTSGITTVGINTTDPNITFDANSNVVVTGIITATKFSGQFEPTSVGIADSIFHTGDTDTVIRFPANNQIQFKTNDTERMIIGSSGNITLNNELRIPNAIAHVGDIDTQIRFPADDTFTVETAGSERLRVASTGNVSIGNNDTPDTLLHLQGDKPKLRVESTNTLEASLGTEEIGRIEFEGTKGSNRNVAASLRVRQDGTWSTVDDWFSPTAIEFYTQDQSGTEITTPRLTITSDGFVGINENTPSRHLHVNSGASDIIAVFESSDASAQIQIKDSNGTCTIECLNDFRFQNGSAEILRLKSDKDVQVMDGNLILASGHGIDFGATSDGSGTTSSEILDEYEEGYYTPTATVGSGSITSTTSFSLRYVKIGGLVHLFGRLHFGTSAFNLTSFSLSLPFANNTANRHDTSCVMHLIRGNGGDPVQGIRIFRVTPGGTTMTMQNHEGQANGNFGTNTPHLNVNFSYFSA